jgi:hypothetical protein
MTDRNILYEEKFYNLFSFSVTFIYEAIVHIINIIGIEKQILQQQPMKFVVKVMKIVLFVYNYTSLPALSCTQGYNFQRDMYE